MKTKIISVFGSNGSGKSLISLLAAEMISRDKSNVCVISLDRQTPMLNVYQPFTEFSSKNSVAKLLTEPITLENLKSCIYSNKNNPYISYLGLVAGDNFGKYPVDFTEARLSELINLIVDFDIEYFIFDLSSNVYTDSIINYLLKNSSKILYVLNPTNSSLSFLDSNVTSELSKDKTIYLLNNCYDYSPFQIIKKERDIKFTVMNNRKLYESYLTGDFSSIKEYYSFAEVLL